MCFVLLFLYATSLYPGGSQANLNSVGFDWINNYWCNLMGKKGMNGALNPARPYAIFAMILLCGSLSVFFYQFAEFLTLNNTWKILIKFGGILSMAFAALVFTDYHDLMTIVSSLFGLFAVVGVIKEIYVSHLWFYKLTGIVCILLLSLNNLIYYSVHFLEWLPFLQKITIVIVLIWVLCVNEEIRKKI